MPEYIGPLEEFRLLSLVYSLAADPRGLECSGVVGGDCGAGEESGREWKGRVEGRGDGAAERE